MTAAEYVAGGQAFITTRGLNRRIELVTVERVTATQVLVKGRSARYRRKDGGRVGGDRSMFAWDTLRPESPDLWDEYRDQQREAEAYREIGLLLALINEARRNGFPFDGVTEACQAWIDAQNKTNEREDKTDD